MTMSAASGRTRSLSQASCLVLGASGFLGAALVGALIDQGADVTAFGRQSSHPSRVRAKARWLQGDFADAAALHTAVTGHDFVFHLIGSSLPADSNLDPAGDLMRNVAPSIRLLEACTIAGVGKILFASSGGTVYGVPAADPIPETSATDPISAYGISKLAVEKYLGLYRRTHGLDYHILRIANAYGPGQLPHRNHGIVSHILSNALDGIAPEIWGDGSVVRDFVHVDDVANAFVHAAIYSGEHRLMNVGSGVGRSMLSVAADLSALAGGPPVIVNPAKARTADVQVNVLDIALIQRETSWRPRVAWEDGIRQTLNWLKEMTRNRT